MRRRYGLPKVNRHKRSGGDMEYRELGRTGVKVSALALDTMTFG
jgi:hypothetical protein